MSYLEQMIKVFKDIQGKYYDLLDKCIEEYNTSDGEDKQWYLNRINDYIDIIIEINNIIIKKYKSIILINEEKRD